MATADGNPFKITFLSETTLSNMNARNAAAAVQQWKKFGIDAEVFPSEARADLIAVGDFDVSGDWPAQEPWGAGPDLYRVLDRWNSAYIRPVGERTQGHSCRWMSERWITSSRTARDGSLRYRSRLAVGIEGPRKPSRICPAIPTLVISASSAGISTTGPTGPVAKIPLCALYTVAQPQVLTPFLEPTGMYCAVCSIIIWADASPAQDYF
jgi:peptide/nickel transport system substrate-binding protein